MIKVEEALALILARSFPLEEQLIPLTSGLHGVLAQDILAQDSLPPFDKSAMDGYALKAETTCGCSPDHVCTFAIVGVIPAGDFYEGELQAGQAIKIMTGAPLPRGADAVIQIEKVLVKGEELVLSCPVDAGENVLKMGEEIKQGERALEKGKLLRPIEIGMLASLGYDQVLVHRKPKIALLITGDELVPITEKPGKGKIRNSNEYSLLALIQSIGADVVNFGIIGDQLPLLRAKMREALEKADVILTTGGASVGDYDFVEDVLKELGAEIHFGSVAIKPGKPVIFATKDRKLFFGLPGNPMAVINTFEQFVKPALQRMMGQQEVGIKEVQAVLADDFKAKKGRRHYVYVQLRWEENGYRAYKIGSQSSNQLMTMSKANGLIIIPEDKGMAKAGETLSARLLFQG